MHQSLRVVFQSKSTATKKKIADSERVQDLRATFKQAKHAKEFKAKDETYNNDAESEFFEFKLWVKNKKQVPSTS